MVRALQKRMIKRSLELIGAIAIVYLMLEALDSNTENHSKQIVRIRRSESEDETNEFALPAEELQKLQKQARLVQKEQEIQKQQQHIPPEMQADQPNEQESEINSDEGAAPIVVEPNLPKHKNKLQENQNKKRPGAKNARKAENDGVNMGPAADSGVLKGKKSPDLGVNTNFGKLNIPIPNLKSSGYVLPMLYFDMGPNNLFRLFRQGAVTAYEMGRSIVVPVFHRHPRMGDAAKNPFVLPIFDTNYTVDLVWPPSETIDVGMLKKVMKVVSMKDFRKECHGKLNALVRCGQVDAKRMDGIKHFQRAAGMKIEKEFNIDTYEKLVPNDLTSGIIGPDEYKCMGVIYGKKCLPDQDRWLATFSRIAKNFWRPLPIRKFTLKFLNDEMKNTPYMAVHWRYESDWLDMCKPSRPKGARERNKAICKITMGLSYDDDLRSSFVQNIKNKMADYNLKKIYLASPPNNIELIRLLNDSFPGNFYFMDDVKAYAKKTEGEGFLTNNYKASFVEQEICFRSTLFLGAALSSWTQTVLTDRLTRNVKRHDSVLEVVGQEPIPNYNQNMRFAKSLQRLGSDPAQTWHPSTQLHLIDILASYGAPGFPKLVFQFPEGNFNFGGMIKGKKG